MLHNGFLVHPDIWMLWFSFFASIFGLVINMSLFLLLWHFRVSVTNGQRGTADKRSRRDHSNHA